MTLHRSFVPSKWLQNQALGSVITLPEDVVHRLASVVRVSKTELVELFDGSGLCVRGYLVSRTSPHFQIESSDVKACSGRKIVLAQALVAQSKLEDIFQHGTEIGVDHFVLFSATNSVVKRTERTSEQIKRLSKIATDAARQCERSDIPKLSGLLSFHELVVFFQSDEATVLVGEPRESVRLVDVVKEIPGERDIALVVGPEGGLHPDEVKALTQIGAQTVRYAPYVLRTQSAGLVGVSIIQSVIR